MAGITGRGLRIVAALILGAALAACQPILRHHGYVPTDEVLALIEVGRDTRDSVALTIGRPSASGVVNDGGFYYVRSEWRQVGPRRPEETDRQVVAISSDQGGRVENIERFTLQDGQVVPLSRRVTDSNIRNVSFLRQLLGGLGRFNAEQFLD